MNLIQKLNSLDIKDLKQLDYDKLLQEVKKKPDIIIIAGLILLTFFFSISYFSKHQRQLKNIRNEISLLKDKNETIEKYNQMKTKLDKFEARILPPVSETEFINKITDYAVNQKMQIESLSPSFKEERELVQLTRIKMRLAAKSYEDIWLFVYDIEESPQNFRIDSWKVDMGVPSNQRQGNDSTTGLEQQIINVDLEISSINFKNE